MLHIPLLHAFGEHPSVPPILLFIVLLSSEILSIKLVKILHELAESEPTAGKSAIYLFCRGASFILRKSESAITTSTQKYLQVPVLDVI